MGDTHLIGLEALQMRRYFKEHLSLGIRSNRDATRLQRSFALHQGNLHLLLNGKCTEDSGLDRQLAVTHDGWRFHGAFDGEIPGKPLFSHADACQGYLPGLEGLRCLDGRASRVAAPVRKKQDAGDGSGVFGLGKDCTQDIA